MTKRTFINVCLLAALLPINELHHLWRDDYKTVNPWLYGDFPINTQWYVKFLGIAISDVIKAIVIFRVSRMNYFFRIAASVLLAFSCYDLVMFFISFNRISYVLPYTFLSLVTILAAFTRKQKYKRQTQDNF